MQQAVAAILFLFVIPVFCPVHAGILINEFSTGSGTDWVELVNVSTESASLTSYRIRDGTDSNKRDLSGELAPFAYTVIEFANALNKKGDRVRLTVVREGTEQTLDEAVYGDQGGTCIPGDGMTIGRLPDGTGGFTVLTAATKGSANTAASPVPCLTPTPTSEPTRHPTQVPVIPTKPPTPEPTVTAVVETIRITGTEKRVKPTEAEEKLTRASVSGEVLSASASGDQNEPVMPQPLPSKRNAGIVYLFAARVFFITSAFMSVASCILSIRSVV